MPCWPVRGSSSPPTWTTSPLEDLRAHGLSAVNPDYFMALRFSEHAYREGVRTLAEVAKNPAVIEAYLGAEEE